MPIQVNEENSGKVLVIHVSGKLEKADYEHFVPEFERLIGQHGKLRVLFDMSDYHGWEFSAAWEDFIFGMKHILAKLHHVFSLLIVNNHDIRKRSYMTIG
ncbi:MAG: STAS/SEC14 domain-containing protein [Proteobacteria bacterium]|nr:STAS/SEC14 domain-containing protein [Pseudomonadota bacterium]